MEPARVMRSYGAKPVRWVSLKAEGIGELRLSRARWEAFSAMAGIPFDGEPRSYTAAEMSSVADIVAGLPVVKDAPNEADHNAGLAKEIRAFADAGGACVATGQSKA